MKRGSRENSCEEIIYFPTIRKSMNHIDMRRTSASIFNPGRRLSNARTNQTSRIPKRVSAWQKSLYNAGFKGDNKSTRINPNPSWLLAFSLLLQLLLPSHKMLARAAVRTARAPGSTRSSAGRTIKVQLLFTIHSTGAGGDGID